MRRKEPEKSWNDFLYEPIDLCLRGEKKAIRPKKNRP